MKQRKSLLWIYILLGSMILETVLVALCLFWHSHYSVHDKSIVMRILSQMIHWWKYSFAAVLLAAFCRTKKYQPNTVKEYFNGGISLFLSLFVKIIYDTALLVVVEIVYVGFSWEYIWICFERMIFYMGAFGIIAIVLGTIAAKIPVRGADYALTGFVAMFVTSILVDFNYYNINPYNPCPIRNPLVFEKETAWRADETYGGSLYKEYEGDREPFSVTDYKLSVWISGDHLLRGEAVMKLSDSTLSEYIFRLNNYIQVEQVVDGAGNELDWQQEGNYILVSGGGKISEITMNYYCDDAYIIPMENHYVSLPSYLMWYPAAPDTESSYSVEVHFDYGVYCNLEEREKNSFQGTAHTVSLLSGTLVGETFIGDVRIIYPKLRFSEYYIRQFYLAQIVQIPQRYGIDVEGFDLFYDDRITTSFWKYYDVNECLADGYMY